MSLPNDYARCAGIEGQQKCEQCARRKQMAIDDEANPPRWFFQMPPAIENGKCVYFLEAA